MQYGQYSQHRMRFRINSLIRNLYILPREDTVLTRLRVVGQGCVVASACQDQFRLSQIF